MGKAWDTLDAQTNGPEPATTQGGMQEWHLQWLKEAFRVLRPGGTAKVFSATRTFHRLAAAMEAVGFVLDPEHSLDAWAYGCLTEDTEVLTPDGWVPYHSAKVGTLIRGFNLQTGAFNWQPVEETFEYPYDREAIHIFGTGTDHIVSVGHRSVVQRDGQWAFISSGELEATEVVPCVQWPVHPEDSTAEDMQPFVWRSSSEALAETTSGTEGPVPQLYGLRDAQVVSRGVDQEGDQTANLFPQVQRGASGSGVGETRPQGYRCGDTCRPGIRHPEDDRAGQPCLEGRGDLLQEARELRQAWSDQIHPVPNGIQANGPQGRVRDGAPADRSQGTGSVFAPNGDGASPEPQPDRQSLGEPGVVCIKPGSQVVRAPWDTSPHLAGMTAHIEHVHYTGIVWCVRVSTGAFVARRKGMAFVTGNSGFPKSLDISKACIKSAGDEITDETKQFSGYGTALKPGWEVFLVGQKPL